MTINTQLEQYLTALDRALGQISVSDRSDIITEIKSHVLEAQARDPQSSVKSILAALGEPENVANRYLMERGIKPGKPSKTPVTKWLTIGFLGTFGIASVVLMLILWRFTPVLKVDEKTGQVIILGGLIEISESTNHATASDSARDKTRVNFEGEAQIDPSKVTSVDISFSNGEFDLSQSTDGALHWSCAVSRGKPAAKEDSQNRSYSLDFNSSDADCDLEIPSGINLVMRGANGEIDVNQPQSTVDVKLENGRIVISPDSSKQYKYQASVVNGSSEGLVSSNSPDAILIKLAVTNGNIEID